MAPKGSTKEKNIPHTPTTKKGRKILQTKLPFSPRSRIPQTNKVFVIGVQLGLILIRTEKATSVDDAFTNDFIKKIEDPDSGVAESLNIIKICSRRIAKLSDKPIVQKSGYNSQFFVTIVDEFINTDEYRRSHVDQVINYLNAMEWKYPQRFALTADETKMDGDKITSTWDMYLCNYDITQLLKQYIFDDFGDLLEDKEAIEGVFGNCTVEEVRNKIKEDWIK